MEEELSGLPDIVCPLCHSGEHVKRLLFYTYCANPVHSHKQGEAPTNTVLEFRWCIEHQKPDNCVPALLGPSVGPAAVDEA
jgi:hypothetical protein